LEFSGLVSAKIRRGGAGKALPAVDGGVDFGSRKNEPILRGSVFQTSHFTELKEAGGIPHFDFALGFAGGLEGLQLREVLLNGAVQPLLIKGEELELLRLQGEDARGGECGIDLRIIGAEVAGVFLKAEGKEVVLDGAGSVETPAVGLRPP
jgi:hypothetical protein